MVSVRVEGFPSPGTETNMEAMVNNNREKRMAEWPLLQELVGDVQLAEEAGSPEEPEKGLHVNDVPAGISNMPAKESQTSVK